MPITRKQFVIGIDPKIEEWMKKIHSFLSQHKDAAFTREELWGALQVQVKPEEWEAWDTALDKLTELKAVGKGIIRGTDYYAYGRDLEDAL